VRPWLDQVPTIGARGLADKEGQPLVDLCLLPAERTSDEASCVLALQFALSISILVVRQLCVNQYIVATNTITPNGEIFLSRLPSYAFHYKANVTRKC
jgi:hypothetical protein